MNETLQRNLQVLSTKNPSLAQKILNHQFSNIEYDQTSSGDYNIIYNGIAIHDTQDPQLEAKMIFGEEEEDEKNLRLVFGLGLGYLFKRTYISSKSTIIIFEPSLDILKATLNVVDFSVEIADQRVFIINNITDIKPIFLTYLFEKISILHLNTYKEIFPKIYEKTYFQLNSFHLDQLTNMRLSHNIANKIMFNTPYIADLPSIHVLKDLFKDKKVLIVGAGPSLNLAINVIKQYRHEFIIICIGQAFKALNSANILPDFVMVIDAWAPPAQIDTKPEIKEKINLILQPAVLPDFFKGKVNSKFIYYPSPDYISEWIAKKKNAKTLTQAGSVSLCAFYVAIELEAKEIILVGQDLAYSNGNIYASNTSNNEIKYVKNKDGKIDFYIEDEGNNELLKGEKLEQKNAHVKSLVSNHKDIIYVKAYNGETIPTSSGYASFITHYEQIAEQLKTIKPNLKIINASVGGAYLEGFKHKTLEECCSISSQETKDLTELITQKYNENLYKDNKNLKSSINKLIIDLKSLKLDAEKVVKNSNRLLSDIRKHKFLSNKNISELKKLQKQNQRVRQYNTNNRISFIYPVIQKELFEHNRIKNKISSNDLEKVLFSIEEINNFSKIMIIATEKVFEAFNLIEDFPFKL